MVRRVVVGAVAAIVLVAPAHANAAYLPVASANEALANYLGGPLPGGAISYRGCARHSATCVICRYTIDQPTPSPEGLTFTYYGIAYVRIRHGRIVVKDPFLAPSAPRPALRW